MPVSIPSVLDELGIGIKPAGIVCRTPGINCLGIIESITDGEIKCPVSIGSFVWHAEPGWAPIDRMELERWLVDSPAGSHWLISERRLLELDRIPIRDQLELDLWGSDDLAQWLGNAVLIGRLKLSMHNYDSNSMGAISERTEKSTPPPIKAITLKPKVILTEWLSQRGYERLPVRPVLLEGREWDVDGHLIGPEGASERNRWTLIDDPFTGQLTKKGDVEALPCAPHLERISPRSWKTQEMVRSELTSVCEERRHWNISQSSSDGEIQGSILHWWRIDEGTAELTNSPILIPGWEVEFPSTGWMLVHGLSGEILNSPCAN
ncbi:MAG TPA: hypothetical protein HA340_07025 [Candidatus Thalassarchaeaceae archaeon]|nr:MAG TPA: hypothetical protein D7H97_06995 [Candidatus Poseidoniales archaeon]HIH83680.1 hypothetical protein [Candidatus Thalassarchaeaceae archaeon]